MTGRPYAMRSAGPGRKDRQQEIRCEVHMIIDNLALSKSFNSKLLSVCSGLHHVAKLFLIDACDSLGTYHNTWIVGQGQAASKSLFLIACHYQVSSFNSSSSIDLSVIGG